MHTPNLDCKQTRVHTAGAGRLDCDNQAVNIAAMQALQILLCFKSSCLSMQRGCPWARLDAGVDNHCIHPFFGKLACMPRPAMVTGWACQAVKDELTRNCRESSCTVQQELELSLHLTNTTWLYGIKTTQLTIATAGSRVCQLSCWYSDISWMCHVPSQSSLCGCEVRMLL